MGIWECCCVVQCVAVCCSVLQCVAVCCSVWHCRMWTSHVTRELVTSHIHESCQVQSVMSRVEESGHGHARRNEACFRCTHTNTYTQNTHTHKTHTHSHAHAHAHKHMPTHRISTSNGAFHIWMSHVPYDYTWINSTYIVTYGSMSRGCVSQMNESCPVSSNLNEFSHLWHNLFESYLNHVQSYSKWFWWIIHMTSFFWHDSYHMIQIWRNHAMGWP